MAPIAFFCENRPDLFFEEIVTDGSLRINRSKTNGQKAKTETRQKSDGTLQIELGGHTRYVTLISPLYAWFR